MNPIEAAVMREYWDVVNADGTPLGYQKCNDDKFTDGEYHLGSSLWIANSAGKLLIQKRSRFKEVGPNLWSITGGKVQAGESGAQACLRELYEELGYVLNERDITYLYRSLGNHMIYDDYITVSDVDLDKAVLNQSEVSEIQWASVSQIYDLYQRGKFLYNNIADLSIVADYLKSV